MAEGLLTLKGEGYEAYSAGVSPTEADPDANRTMAKIGIDISGQLSKGTEEIKGINFDVVVTVCYIAKEVCPFFPEPGN
jgi:arsenate reductase